MKSKCKNIKVRKKENSKYLKEVYNIGIPNRTCINFSIR